MITSAKEIMFYSAFVCPSVCLSVCLLTTSCKNYESLFEQGSSHQILEVMCFGLLVVGTNLLKIISLDERTDYTLGTSCRSRLVEDSVNGCVAICRSEVAIVNGRKLLV